MIIAELLDHADTQNVDVYTANTPEFAAKLDEKLGFLMAPYARAFMGIVVDKEQDAKRGNDLSSRIRHNGAGAGTCGTYGYCGANAPIPCYTCTNFQPWLDGPHEKVYQDLLNDRKRVQPFASLTSGEGRLGQIAKCSRCCGAVADEG